MKWPVDKQQEQTGHDARALARPLATARLCRTRSRHRQTAPDCAHLHWYRARAAKALGKLVSEVESGEFNRTSVTAGQLSTIGLKRLAALAATAPPTSLGAGQYAYTEVERPTMTSVGTSKQGGPSITEYFTGTVQTWVAADGSGRQVTTTDATPHFYTAADQAAWVAEGSPPGVIPPSQLTTVQVFGPDTASEVNGPIPLYNVTGLPTDPTTLSQLLNNENPGAQSLGTLPAGIKSLDFASSCMTAACTLFERAAALLEGPDIGSTPALRQALFQVLATVPGVELLGTSTDPAGQSGVGLALIERQPAGTSVINCASSNEPTSASSGRILYNGITRDTTITSSTTEHYPASSTTFSIVVDPQTTTGLSSEESSSRLFGRCRRRPHASQGRRGPRRLRPPKWGLTGRT